MTETTFLCALIILAAAAVVFFTAGMAARQLEQFFLDSYPGRNLRRAGVVLLAGIVLLVVMHGR